jgi:hypothetical protein
MTDMAVPQSARAREAPLGAQFLDYTAARFWALFALVFLILVSRKPDAFFHAQFYAEDAVVFYREQLVYGVRSLLFPYNGYLHLVPRFTALLASFFPAIAAPFIFSVVGAVLQSFSYTFVYRPECRYLLHSDALRAAAAVVLAAVLNSSEMLGNVLQVQWHLILVGLILLFLPNGAGMPESGLGRKAAVFLSLVICFTTPMLVVVLPFSVWRMLKSSGREAIIGLAFAIALTLQALVFLASPAQAFAPFAGGTLTLMHHLGIALVVSWTYLVFLANLAGKDLAVNVDHAATPALFYLSVCSVALAFLWLALRATRHERKVLLVCLYLAAASIAIPLATRHYVEYFQSFTGATLTVQSFTGANLIVPRYFTTSAYILTFLIARQIDGSRLFRRQWMKPLVLIAVFACGIRGNFKAAPDPDTHWTASSQAVQTWIDDRRRGIAAPHVEVPILPAPPWTLSLPGSDEH